MTYPYVLGQSSFGVGNTQQLETTMFSKVYWNYRVVCYVDGAVGLHEVYYSESEQGTSIAVAESPILILDEPTKDCLQSQFDKFERALTEPFLDEKDVLT